MQPYRSTKDCNAVKAQSVVFTSDNFVTDVTSDTAFTLVSVFGSANFKLSSWFSTSGVDVKDFESATFKLVTGKYVVTFLASLPLFSQASFLAGTEALLTESLETEIGLAETEGETARLNRILELAT